MKKVLALALYAVLLISAYSCKPAVETPLQEESFSTSGSLSLMPSNSNNTSELLVATPDSDGLADSAALLLLSEDEAEMIRVMIAGKQFISALQCGEQPINASERFAMPDGGLDALAAFERFFIMDTLYVSGVFINPKKAEPYICMISGIGRYRMETQRVQLHFDRSEPIKWSCSLVYYNPLIDYTIERYLGYLRDEDAYGLASWLSGWPEPDDAIISAVRKTIDYYTQHDLSEVIIKDDLWIVESDFYYAEGYRRGIVDAIGYSFCLELICGDGYCFPCLVDWMA